MREIDALRLQLKEQRETAKNSETAIAALRATCEHHWILGPQRLRNEECKKWWIHRVCAKCDAPYSELFDVPVCPQCEQPLMPAEDGVRAGEAKADAQAADPDATATFAFDCIGCGTIHGFSFRGSKKK